MTHAVRFLVRGRVQGVGYRWFVARHAAPLGLSGFARNNPDGTVEVLAVGPPSEIDRLERELWRGPEFAAVESVEKADVLVEVELYKSFDIN